MIAPPWPPKVCIQYFRNEILFYKCCEGSIAIRACSPYTHCCSSALGGFWVGTWGNWEESWTSPGCKRKRSRHSSLERIGRLEHSLSGCLHSHGRFLPPQPLPHLTFIHFSSPTPQATPPGLPVHPCPAVVWKRGCWLAPEAPILGSLVHVWGQSLLAVAGESCSLGGRWPLLPSGVGSYGHVPHSVQHWGWAWPGCLAHQVSSWPQQEGHPPGWGCHTHTFFKSTGDERQKPPCQKPLYFCHVFSMNVLFPCNAYILHFLHMYSL